MLLILSTGVVMVYWHCISPLTNLT